MNIATTSKACISFILLLSLVASGAACSPRSQDCITPGVYCVGLVTDFGGVSTGIQHEAWLALQDAKATGLIDRIDRIETIDARDRAANIEAFASSGYDVIVTVGASISSETVAAAQRYPKLLFIGVEQPQKTDIGNLTGLIFHEERSGFLAGVLATIMTRTRRVAAVCEARFLDPVRRYCDGFQAGVVYADPSVSVSVTYRDGSLEKVYQDRAWGETAALDRIQNGADVLFAAGGDTALAALEAAAAKGALVIGAESDLYPQLPAVRAKLLTCSVNYVRHGVLDLLGFARIGQFPGGEYMGRAGLSPFHDLEASISLEARGRMLRLEQALNDGSLQPDIAYDNPSD